MKIAIIECLRIYALAAFISLGIAVAIKGIVIVLTRRNA